MRAKSVFNKHSIFYTFVSILIGIANLTLGSSAQGTNQSIYLPPGQSSQGAPPPIGDGPSSGTIVPGDTQAENVPTGRPAAAPVYGTNFPHNFDPKRRARINLLIDRGKGKGKRIVLTFQPGQLTNEQKEITVELDSITSKNEPTAPVLADCVDPHTVPLQYLLDQARASVKTDDDDDIPAELLEGQKEL